MSINMELMRKKLASLRGEGGSGEASVWFRPDEGETIFNGIDELRYKERNRVEAIKINLKNMGANILLNKDKIKINGPNILHNTSIKTYSDHRIAMTFTIAGLLSGKFNNIDDESCIDTSFPDFYNILKEISLWRDLQ